MEAGSAKQSNRDWAAKPLTFMLYWGLPIVAMLAAIFTLHPAKTLIWTAALLWMGCLCILNALRCGRVHCFFTGPFFIVMSIVVVMHGYEIVWLGAEGWKWLGLSIGLGGGGLWCLTEKIIGRYGRPSAPANM